MCVLTFHPTPSHLLILTMYPLCRYLPPHGIGLLYSFRFETECDIYPALFCWNIFLGLGTLLLVLICNFLPLSTVVGRQRRELKTGHLRPVSKYVGRWCLERACNGMVLSPSNVGAPFFFSSLPLRNLYSFPHYRIRPFFRTICRGDCPLSTPFPAAASPTSHVLVTIITH